MRDWLRRLRLHEFRTAKTTRHNGGGYCCHCASTGRNGWNVVLASALLHHVSGEERERRACGSETSHCDAFGEGQQVPWSLSIARLRPLTMPARSQNTNGGGVPERLKGTDCKSVGARLRWFESNPLHQGQTAFGSPAAFYAKMTAIGVSIILGRRAHVLVPVRFPFYVRFMVWPTSIEARQTLRKHCSSRRVVLGRITLETDANQ